MTDAIASILIGLGLAAACGFRVFVPLAALAIAHRAGFVGLSSGLEWLGSTAAITALLTATVLEIVAYKVPWLDHALDTIATPAAVIAGAVIAASQVGSISPSGEGGHLLLWGSGLVAGGAAAGAVQAGTVTTRAASTATTAGLANPIISAGQSVLAVVTSAATIVAPIVGVALIVGIGAVLMLMFLAARRAVRAVRPA